MELYDVVEDCTHRNAYDRINAALAKLAMIGLHHRRRKRRTAQPGQRTAVNVAYDHLRIPG